MGITLIHNYINTFNLNSHTKIYTVFMNYDGYHKTDDECKFHFLIIIKNIWGICETLTLRKERKTIIINHFLKTKKHKITVTRKTF